MVILSVSIWDLVMNFFKLTARASASVNEYRSLKLLSSLLELKDNDTVVKSNIVKKLQDMLRIEACS